MADLPRCDWATGELEARYHDLEWGVPVRGDDKLFEMLILEGAQAGLSWSTILRKRDRYREVFAKFDPVAVARFTPARVKKLLADPGIVRNRAKVAGTVTNARRFLEVRREFGSFAAYLRGFDADGAEMLSRDLKKRGFTFVGPTIMCAFMQAVGMRDDHQPGCWRAKARRPKGTRNSAPS